MENPLIITVADYALLLAHAKSAVMIHNTDNNAITQIKLRYQRKLEEVEQRVKPAPEHPKLSTVEDCNGDNHLVRMVTDDKGVEYMICDSNALDAITGSQDDALDIRIAYYMGVHRMVTLTNAQCLEVLELNAAE